MDKGDVPAVKASDGTERCGALRALHTTRGPDRVRHRSAGDEVGHHRSARSLAQLLLIGLGPRGQTTPTSRPLLGWRSGLCSLEAADHASGGTDGFGAG